MSEKQAVLPEIEITPEDTLRTDEGYQDLGDGDRWFYTTRDKDDEGDSIYFLAEKYCCRERQLLTLLQSLADAGIEVKDGKIAGLESIKARAKSEGLLEAAGIATQLDECKGQYIAERIMDKATDLLPLIYPAPPTDSTKEVA